MPETQAAREARIRYQNSPKGRETARRRNATEKERARRREYASTAQGRAASARSKNRKRDRIRAIAQEAGCMDCGSRERLHFHHREPDMKLFPITRAAGLAWIRIEAEIEKCDVVCDPCHKKRHVAMRASS